MNGRILKLALLIVGWSLCCGCVTKRLWENSGFNEPCPNSNLHLYYSQSKDDVLVVYDELHEPYATARKRAYYLFQSSAHVNPAKPTFVDAREANGLEMIPIISTNDVAFKAKTNRFARVDASGETFTLNINGGPRGPFDLPVYRSGFDRAVQISLTPVAVAADTVIVGSVVGAVVAYGWADGKTSGYNSSF